jgi:Protein of unknown function (DUF3108)
LITNTLHLKMKSITLFRTTLAVAFMSATMAFVTPTTPPQYSTTSLDNSTDFPTQIPYSACTEVLDVPFQAGEELVYKIYYNLNFVWIPAGEATFKVEDEGNRYHFSATGVTYDSYEWFYKVRDYFHSYTDKQTLLPQTAIRHVSENKYKIYDKVDFDQKNRKATYLRGQTQENAATKGNLTLSDCMHDVLSIIYYSRTFDYATVKAGQEFPVKVMLDEEAYSLKYRFLAREEKSIRGLGKFSAMRFSPQLVAGNVFNEKAQMKIWASDDANKIPLMIESPVSVGSVKVVLKSWKGLRYDLSSKK